MRNFGLLRAVAIVGVLALGAQQAGAMVITFQASLEFSGGTQPAGPQPWVTASFDDYGSAGSVSMTLTATNLIGSEFVSEWDFNLDPGLSVGSLVFSNPTKTGTFTDPEIDKGTDQFKADGDGKFDIHLAFSTSNTDDSRFGVGEAVRYTITGIPTLTAGSFHFPSAPGGGNGSFPMAAHVQGIGSQSKSGWVSTPEPATLALLILGGLVGARRRR